MAEKLITRSHESKMSAERKKNLMNHLVRPAGALVLGAAFVGGVAVAGEHIFHEEEVGSTIEHVPAGGSPIGTVDTAVERIANQQGFSPDSVGNIVGAGQEVSGELIAQHPGQPVQSGEAIEVTVVKNGLGQLSAKADPANLAHLDK